LISSSLKIARAAWLLVKELARDFHFGQSTRAVNQIEFQARLRSALAKATHELLAARHVEGFWEGELSSSALSTATAVTALALAVKHRADFHSALPTPHSAIDSGLQWLAEHQNSDGGWGDTTKSISNISTTTLCWAAFGAGKTDQKFTSVIGNAERWLAERVAVSESTLRSSHSALATAIIARYGKDRTFSVPILTMCALAGRLGTGREAWQHIIPLPFELAACPHQLFAALRLPVVSYALPALIAIGLAHHVHAPSRNPIARIIRNATREKTLRVLTKIQPDNGGFLEATPLTSFVTMSLTASGLAHHIVTQRGLEFLRKSQRTDGSWPIDTNLATWCTTLAIDALPRAALGDGQCVMSWLLYQQYRVEHAYTHAAPGGWAWTDLPGGVPDADDTAGALLALAQLHEAGNQSQIADIPRAAEASLRWLLQLQNRDGGIPTFCRGWGALPFDRSSADITAHAIRAWLVWEKTFQHHRPIHDALALGIAKALAFLVNSQRADGSWIPLWFGNERSPHDENPTYGTARVLTALKAALPWTQRRDGAIEIDPSFQRAVAWFCAAQNGDGSWGGAPGVPGSVEETALAVEALTGISTNEARAAARHGTQWLIKSVEAGTWREPSPIGFYFAKLWYFERLYPLIFTVGALRAVNETETS
jgi:squalene-hopene/tetraprenyl-beta-curcumene cyclase